MTEPTDWRRFVALMAKAGWKLSLTNGVFVHVRTGSGYHVDGHYARDGAERWSKGSVPQWREYLARDETPVPW